MFRIHKPTRVHARLPLFPVIHRKEAQARRRDVVELAVAVRHQFVALLGSGRLP